MVRKLCIVHQYFYPELAGSAQQLTDLAINLRRLGWEVTVYTGRPSYLGRKRMPRREVYQGVIIYRVFKTQLNKNVRLGRIFNAFTFFISAVFHLLFRKKAEGLLFIGTDPPFLGLVGWMLKKLRGQRYVLLIQDIYPDVATKVGYLRPNSPIVRLWEWVNALICGGATHVITLGDHMKKTVQRKWETGRNGSITVIHNWADGDLITPREKERNWFCNRYALVDKTVVLYSGNMGVVHDLETIIVAARELRHSKDIRFVFIGDGAKKHQLVNVVKQHDIDNVLFLPYQPRENTPFSLTCGDVSVITMERGTEGLLVPGKLYSSLAAGQAILGIVGENSEIAEIIKTYSCGFRVDQGDTRGVVESINRLQKDKDLLETLKKNARRCFEENFTKDHALKKYNEVFQEVVSS
ncbi:MAG: glycosyltransferase family 4 protein [Candidatus Brocadiales bacterium]